MSIYIFLASLRAGFDNGVAMDKPKLPARAKLLNAARALFFEKGVDATSTAEICRLSGVSNGSLFHHFENKEAIAVAIFLDVRSDYWAYVLSAMEACSDVLDAAEASVYAAFEFQKENEAAYFFMLDVSAAPWIANHQDAIRSVNEPNVARAMRWAAPHIMAGTLPMFSVHTFGALIFGLPQWIAREVRAGLSPPDIEVVAKEIAALMRKAFAP